MGDLTKDDRIEPVRGSRWLVGFTALLVHGVAMAGVAVWAHAVSPSVPLSRLLDHADLPGSAVVAALPEGRHHAGTAELVYGCGLDTAQAGAHRDWDAFAAPEPVRAVSDGGVLGYQARYLGTLRRIDDAAPAGQVFVTLRVLRAVREIGPGARLLPHRAVYVGPDDMPAASEPSPQAAVKARVAAMLADGQLAGSGHVVVLDAGGADGLARGQALVIRRRASVAGAPAGDPLPAEPLLPAPAPPAWTAPDHVIAQASVLATASHIAYALVTEATDAVRVGDDALPALAPTR